jgi:hypothetical protein
MRGLRKADRKVNLFMGSQNVGFVTQPFFIKTAKMSSPNLAVGRERWMLKVLPARLSTQSKTIF